MKLRVLVLMLGVLLTGCKKEAPEIIRPVETVLVSSLPEELVYEYPAIVIAENESMLSFKVAGPIEKLEVEVGSYVKKGDVIAKMDTRDYEVQLKAFQDKSKVAKNVYESAKAIATNAKKQYERVEILYKEKAIPKKSYDEALAGVKAATSGELAAFSQYQEALQGVENSKNQLKDTILIAPYDGYISKKFADEGNVVKGGIPVVTIASIGNKQVRINVSERDVKSIPEGKGTFVYEDNLYNLKLAQVGKVKSIGKMTYPVTFNFEQGDPNLLVDTMGMVKLSYKTDDKKEVIIPVESIFEKDGKSKVWIYKDGQVTSRDIKMVSPYNNGKIIVEGVNLGDKIVTRGVHELSDGQKVNEVKAFSETNVGKVL